MPLLDNAELIVPASDNEESDFHYTKSILDDQTTVIEDYNEKNHTKLDDLYGNLSYCCFRYIGGGCFSYDAYAEYEPYNASRKKTDYQKHQLMMLYNAENNKAYNLFENGLSKIASSSRPFIFDGVKYIVIENAKGQILRLDLDRMIAEEITTGGADAVVMTDKLRKTEVYVNDDMIYFRNDENAEDNGFYDIMGKKLIDLSGYDIQSYALAFIGGTCKFVVKNDSNQLFKLTIDKTGKVIDQERTDNIFDTY